MNVIAPTNNAERWSDAWAEAYERRANGLGKMPLEVKRKMERAYERMELAFKREQELREMEQTTRQGIYRVGKTGELNECIWFK